MCALCGFFFESSTYAERFFRSVIMMTAVVTIFDTYKRWYQSTKAFPPLITFSLMRLPWVGESLSCFPSQNVVELARAVSL